MSVKWGTGRAELVPPSTTADTETVVFLSDIHIPYQDTAAVTSALRLVRYVKPDRVVINGDVADFFQLSRFNTGGERMDHLQEEIDEANRFRASVRKVAPNAVIDETEGNHDNRIRTYVEKNARALKTLRALDPETLFDYKPLEIRWHPGAGFRLRPHFLVKHGTLVRSEAGVAAKAEYAAAGVSGISGHTHRLATYRRAGYQFRSWTEQGCLCRLDPDYIVGPPNWVQGCAVGEFSTRTDAYLIHELQFVDGKLRFGAKAF